MDSYPFTLPQTGVEVTEPKSRKILTEVIIFVDKIKVTCEKISKKKDVRLAVLVHVKKKADG